MSDGIEVELMDQLPASPRAGWYSDPYGRFPRRWWDGTAWTAYAADTDVRWDDTPLGPAAPSGQSLPGLGIALIGAVLGVALAFGSHLLFNRLGEPGGPAVRYAVSALALWLGLLGACGYVSRSRGTGSVVRDFALHFRWIDLGLGVAGAIVSRVVAVSAVMPMPLPTRRLGEAEEEVFEGVTRGLPEVLVMLAIVCVGAPLIEELYFRGLLQGRLVHRFGPPVGIVLTSLLFGAAHLGAWSGSETLVWAWAVACGGLVLGVMRHYSGRLGAPIVAHAVFNTQAMVVVLLFA